MGLLPDQLVSLDAQGRRRPGADPFRRIDPRTDGRRFAEADWDRIICENVDALADALRAANVIAPDSALRVLGREYSGVDVLFAEVAQRSGADASDPIAWGEPRRLVLLEDKLIRNPEAKRQVLAQLFDYAQRAQNDWHARSLASAPQLAGAAKWLLAHQHPIEAILRHGEFLLIIAGDDIDEDLLRLARRFATRNNPLSLEELCLVALPLYARGDDLLLVPHVVSAVERHQRELAVRVTVQDSSGALLPATIARDHEREAQSAGRSSLPSNPAAQAFLERAKEVLDRRFGTDTYGTTEKPRKSLDYAFEPEAGSYVRFKIHFGGFTADRWSPIQVGVYIESRANRASWRQRLDAAQLAGELPDGTKIQNTGSTTVYALKDFPWVSPSDLTAELLAEVTTTLARFVSLFSAGSPRL